VALALPLALSLVALAKTPTLVALAPQTQWLMVPSGILAYMLTQKGADEAVHAMAMGSLKHDELSRQLETEAELMHLVMISHLAASPPGQQPNHLEAEL
jgi:hypothetical protein